MGGTSCPDLAEVCRYTDPSDSEVYTLDDVDVRLERRLAGTTTWLYVSTGTTNGFWPVFEFDQVARQNTQFRVTFDGDAEYGPSQDGATVKVHRIVTARVVKPRPNVFFLKSCSDVWYLSPI